MSERQPALVSIMVLLAVFATFLLVLLFTAVTKVRADVIRPNFDEKLISVTAGGAAYDASTGLLTIDDATGAFTYRRDGTAVSHFIYNLDHLFGGGYHLEALFDTVGTNAPLDGMFAAAATSDNDLVITGEIPTMNISQANGYTGTLLTAELVTGELFGYSSTNATAEYNLILRVTGGDLVTAGEYRVGEGMGGLSVLLSLDPTLPSGCAFDDDFDATTQSGSVGVLVPEPATTTLLGLGVFGVLGVRRLRRRGRK